MSWWRQASWSLSDESHPHHLYVIHPTTYDPTKVAAASNNPLDVEFADAQATVADEDLDQHGAQLVVSLEIALSIEIAD